MCVFFQIPLLMWFFFAWNSLISRSPCTVSIAFVSFFSNSSDRTSFFRWFSAILFVDFCCCAYFVRFCYALIRNVCLSFNGHFDVGRFVQCTICIFRRHNFFSVFAWCLTQFAVCYINLVVALMSSFHSYETRTHLFSVCSHASFCINSSSTRFTCKSCSVAIFFLLMLLLSGLCFWVIVFNRF